MNLKKFISGVSAIAIAATTFASLAITASAAGYTRTLTADLEIPGYNAVQLYDFQNNDPEVLPTSGEARYRAYENGGYWGLHNYASGNRGATVSIPVSEGDILVIEGYYKNQGITIDCGAKNETLTSSTAYDVYDITKDADSITFAAIPRGSGIIAALVMEQDTEAKIVEYTFNYYCGDTLVKSDKATAAVGTLVNATVPFTYDGVKYIALDDATTSMTVKANAEENVVTVNVRKADSFNVTLKSNIGDTVKTAEVVEGEDATLYYNKYALVDKTLYEAPALTKEGNGYAYSYKFLNVTGDAEYTVEYTVKNDSEYVFYAEAEDIDTLTTASTNNNIPIRCSGGNAAYAAEDAVITNLPAGKYKIAIATFGNAGTTFTATIGDNTINATTKGYLAEDVSDEFTVTEATDVVIGAMGNGGSSPKVIDYICIIKTGDVEPETQDITIDKVATYTGDSEVANDNGDTTDVITLFKKTIENISGTISGVTIDNEAVEEFDVDNATVLTDAAAVVAIIVNAAANTASITVTLD